MWGEGEGRVYGWPGDSTAERRREVATELTVLKIAKSKIPGALVAVVCGSEGSEKDEQNGRNMDCWVPSENKET